MSDTVFVVALSWPYEGHSEPLACFSKRHLAEDFAKAQRAAYWTDAEVFEMEVVSLPTPPKEGE